MVREGLPAVVGNGGAPVMLVELLFQVSDGLWVRMTVPVVTLAKLITGRRTPLWTLTQVAGGEFVCIFLCVHHCIRMCLCVLVCAPCSRC